MAGDNFYRYLLTFETWSDYWNAIRQVEDRTDSDEGWPDELYRVGSPVQQYLMQTGRSCLLDMTLDDLHRLQLDIEVYTEGGFPNADRPEDKVIIVALSDNRGWDEVLHLRNGINEATLLKELVHVLRERDPDVIEGHNVFEFDLSYLLDRCALHDVDFAIGRDGSVPRTYDSSMRFAERTVDYPAVDIVGRHVIDTYFQVMSFDVFSRDLPDYSLKTAARYFGLAPEERTYIEGTDISRAWREDREELLDYALDDVTETKRLAGHLSGSTFYLAQMLPMTYGSSARRGPATKIESLFVREYLRRRHALPRSKWGSQSMGGYTDIFLSGVMGPIVYADVESLYPSIMLNYNVQPSGDTLDLFPQLLERLTDLRLETKEDMRNAEDEEVRSELDARQSSYKVLINSFYGMLGFSLSAFNDFAEADRVARTGQQILRDLIDEIRGRGGTVIEVDTDGVLFVPPDGVRGEQAETDFTVGLTEAMPEGIRVGFDGRFQKMLSYKKKNYALLTYDDELKFKGSSLISRSNEPFGRDFVRRAIRRLLDHDVEGLHALYVNTRDKIIEHDWESIDSFARTETLKDTLEDYEADVEAGSRPRAATYELAKKKQERTGKPIKKGDRISYYITGDSANVTAFKNCKLAAEWVPTDPDENTAYYLRRLDEFATKFEPFFTEDDFRLVFSPEDLFGFSATEIDIQTTRHESEYEENQDEVPF
ncbi:DNA polymerase domain-containing protein [Salinibacter altiplanensis]|uniref:DNA polymerase domain-containing protein n=1 Tax=Salinibacter altiplanensis TaxID=1803181 RepID=UPI001E4481CE|nr:DNA polymerase domain-containing protein [Salinibacter altiplanensis]